MCAWCLLLPSASLEQERICTHTSVCTLLLPSACSSVIQPSRQLFPLYCEFLSGWSYSVFSCQFGDSSIPGVPDKFCTCLLSCGAPTLKEKWKGHTMGVRESLYYTEQRTLRKGTDESQQWIPEDIGKNALLLQGLKFIFLGKEAALHPLIPS